MACDCKEAVREAEALNLLYESTLFRNNCVFRLIPITRFGRCRSPISAEGDHPFRRCRSGVSADVDHPFRLMPITG